MTPQWFLALLCTLELHDWYYPKKGRSHRYCQRCPAAEKLEPIYLPIDNNPGYIWTRIDAPQ